MKSVSFKLRRHQVPARPSSILVLYLAITAPTATAKTENQISDFVEPQESTQVLTGVHTYYMIDGPGTKEGDPLAQKVQHLNSNSSAYISAFEIPNNALSILLHLKRMKLLRRVYFATSMYQDLTKNPKEFPNWNFTSFFDVLDADTRSRMDAVETLSVEYELWTHMYDLEDAPPHLQYASMDGCQQLTTDYSARYGTRSLSACTVYSTRIASVVYDALPSPQNSPSGKVKKKQGTLVFNSLLEWKVTASEPQGKTLLFVSGVFVLPTTSRWSDETSRLDVEIRSTIENKPVDVFYIQLHVPNRGKINGTRCSDRHDAIVCHFTYVREFEIVRGISPYRAHPCARILVTTSHEMPVTRQVRNVSVMLLPLRRADYSLTSARRHIFYWLRSTAIVHRGPLGQGEVSVRRSLLMDPPPFWSWREETYLSGTSSSLFVQQRISVAHSEIGYVTSQLGLFPKLKKWVDETHFRHARASFQSILGTLREPISPMGMSWMSLQSASPSYAPYNAKTIRTLRGHLLRHIDRIFTSVFAITDHLTANSIYSKVHHRVSMTRVQIEANDILLQDIIGVMDKHHSTLNARTVDLLRNRRSLCPPWASALIGCIIGVGVSLTLVWYVEQDALMSVGRYIFSMGRTQVRSETISGTAVDWYELAEEAALDSEFDLTRWGGQNRFASARLESCTASEIESVTSCDISSPSSSYVPNSTATV